MKYALIALLLATGTAQAAHLPSRQECTVNESDALEALNMSKNAYASGSAGKAEVDAAQLALNDLQLSCADIVRGNSALAGSYCAQASVDTMTEYVALTQSEFAVGSVLFSEVELAKSKQAAMNSICAP